MKIGKFIFSLACGCIVLFSAFILSSCSLNCGGATTPVEQNQPNTNDNSSNNNTNNNGNNNQGGNTGDDEQEFSAILYKILTDKTYMDLAEYVRLYSSQITPELKPIPYKFLRNQGHDVDAYLDGTLDVFASSYIYYNDKNHIYVSVKAENVSTSQYGNYYTNYVLKYPLTDQEYEEYTHLCDNEYLQGLFYIQELDNQKTPEVQSKVNIAKQTYEYMINSYGKSVLNPNKYNSIEIDITYLNENMISVSLRSKSNKNYYATTIGFANLETIPDYTRVYKYDNDVYYIVDAYQVNVLDLDKYPSSLQNITSFSYGTEIKYSNPFI